MSVILDISKGWVISTNHRSSRVNNVLLIFYALSQISVFLWGIYGVDPAATIYVYESVVGGVLIAFRMLVMFYFCYNIARTYGYERDHPRKDQNKLNFYIIFGLYGTAWFLVLPVTVLVAHFLKAWVRFIVVTTWTFTLQWVFFFGITYLFFPWATLGSDEHNNNGNGDGSSSPHGGSGSSGANGHHSSGGGITGGLVMDPNQSRAFAGNTMQIFPELPMTNLNAI